jgi:hypothetical protein
MPSRQDSTAKIVAATLLFLPIGIYFMVRSGHRKAAALVVATSIALLVVIVATSGSAPTKTLPMAAGATRPASTVVRKARCLPNSMHDLNDKPGNSGRAPDVRFIVTGVDSCEGQLSVTLKIKGSASALRSGQSVLLYLDTDGNPATGSRLYGGAEVLIGFTPALGTVPQGAIWERWNGHEFGQPRSIHLLVQDDMLLALQVPFWQMGVRHGRTIHISGMTISVGSNAEDKLGPWSVRF